MRELGSTPPDSFEHFGWKQTQTLINSGGCVIWYQRQYPCGPQLMANLLSKKEKSLARGQLLRESGCLNAHDKCKSCRYVKATVEK